MNETSTTVDQQGEEGKTPTLASAAGVVPQQQLQLQQKRWICDSAICHTQEITSIEALACADTVEDIVPKNPMSRCIKSIFETESLLEGAAEDSANDDDDEHTLNTYEHTFNTSTYNTHASDQQTMTCGMILNSDGTVEVPTISPVPSGAVTRTLADEDKNIVLQGDTVAYRNATNDLAAANTTKIAIAATLSSILPATTAAHRSSLSAFSHRFGSKEQQQDKEASSLDATLDTAVNTTMESAASLTFAPWIGSDGDADSDNGNDHDGNHQRQQTTEQNRCNDTNTDNNTNFTRKMVSAGVTTDDQENQTNGYDRNAIFNRNGYRGSGAIARESSIEVIGRGVKKVEEKKKHAMFLSLLFWKTNHHRGKGKNSSKNKNIKGYRSEEETTNDDVNSMKEKRYQGIRSSFVAGVSASAKKSNNSRSSEKKRPMVALWKKTVEGAKNLLRISKPFQ
mmetsp:Transcript_13460/g.28218  ORF Transcript_13460/g.28218 Transcript_13460/m.28218 type:complete len:453 (+) Transcript_13460:218-1576(+)